MEEGAVTMCYVHGMYIMGKLEIGIEHGATFTKLIDPRIFTTFVEEEKDPKTGKVIEVPKIHLAPPPGQPPFVILGDIGMKYVYPPTDNVLKLYAQVTKPPEKRIFTGGNLN